MFFSKTKYFPLSVATGEDVVALYLKEWFGKVQDRLGSIDRITWGS